MDNITKILGTKTPVAEPGRAARGFRKTKSGFLRVIFSVFKSAFKAVSIILAAAAGNFVGDKLRAQVTQTPGHQLEFVQTDEYGNTFIAANLLLSNFLPAILVSLFARPRWAFAFLGGLVASFIMGDHYEDWLWEKLDELLTGGDPTRNWPQPELPQPAARPHP